VSGLSATLKRSYTYHKTDRVYHQQDFRVQEDPPESPSILEIHKRQHGE